MSENSIQAELPDPDQLLSKLSKNNDLTKEEIELVVELLEAWGQKDIPRERSLDDLYSYLVVVKRAGLREQHRVLERFLDARDALTVSLVLETLCLDWGMSKEYLERAVSFSLGAPWDDGGDAQELALKILGEHLRTDSLPELLKAGAEQVKLSDSQAQVLDLLVSTLEDQNNDDWVRQAAYFALCRGFGKEWEDLPSECSLLTFDGPDKTIDTGLIDLARNLSS